MSSDPSVLKRLSELEAEMGVAAAGTRLPPDPQLAELMCRLLSSHYPACDLQIVVSSCRKTTTTKQYYDTETPGMVGLNPEKLRDLQRKLMDKISSTPAFDGTAKGDGEEDGGGCGQNGEASRRSGGGGPRASVDNGGSAAASQHPAEHTETLAEEWASADGSQVVSKKMTRAITTTQSAVSGADEHSGAPSVQGGGHVSGAPQETVLHTRLPLNHNLEQVFDARMHPQAQPGVVRVIPIRRVA